MVPLFLLVSFGLFFVCIKSLYDAYNTENMLGAIVFNVIFGPLAFMLFLAAFSVVSA